MSGKPDSRLLQLVQMRRDNVRSNNVRGKNVRVKMSEVIMSEVKMSEVKMSEVIMSEVIMSEQARKKLFENGGADIAQGPPPDSESRASPEKAEEGGGGIPTKRNWVNFPDKG